MSEIKILGADAAAVESAGSIASDQLSHAAPTHTPGPWVAECSTLREAREDGGFSWAHPDSWGPRGWTDETRVGSVYLLCEGGGHTGLPGSIEVSEANAHLIAAAPEMYEALKLAVGIAESWIHDQLDGTSSLDGALEDLKPCHAAIAKAEGK
jgi:hypothetical protein